MTIPYTFAGATTAIPLAQLDANFASPITLGNVAMTLSNTYTSIGNLTLTNVTVSSGNVAVTNANVTTLIATNDASISGLTVGRGNSSLSANTALGASALSSATTGNYATAVGYQAGIAQTTGSNEYFGAKAGFSTTTASGSVYLGSTAGYTNTTGANNVAVGNSALYSNTTASNNTAVGYQAGYSNTTGTQQTLLGYQAGFNLTTQGYNTLIGYQAGLNINGTFGQNCFVGTSSGQSITSGYNNTIIGSYSGNQGGLDIRTASNYIVLSDGAGNPRGIFDSGGTFLVGITSSIYSGKQCIQYASNTGRGLVIYDSTIQNNSTFAAFMSGTSTSIGSITANGTTAVLYNTTSDYRLKTDVTPIQNALTTIQALNPVSFTWIDGRKDDGFLAHELQAIIPNCVTGEKDAINEDGTPKYQQLDNSGVIPFLVKAIQELKAEIDQLKAK